MFIKNYFLVGLAAASLMACRNDDGNGTNTTIVQPTAIPVLPTKISQHDYTDNTDMDITLNYNGDKLTVMQGTQGADVSRITFEYTGDLITKTTTTDSSSNDVTTYSYTGGKLAGSSSTGSDGLYRYASTTTMTYNADGTVTAQEVERTTKPTDPTYNITTTSNRVYTLTNGQVAKIVDTSTIMSNGSQGGSTKTATYTYDAKNAIFKNVKGFNQLAYGLKDFTETFSFTQNNYASITVQSTWANNTTTNISVFNHTYNTNGYPVKSTLMENGTRNSDYTITYNN